MKRILCAVLAFALTLCCCACQKREPANEECTAKDLTGDIAPQKVDEFGNLSESSAVVTDFALRLFQNTEKEGENCLISPLSVLCALSMTAGGAKGETLAQMEQVLGMETGALNAWIHTYMAQLPQEEDYKLNLANSVWFRDVSHFTVEQSFLQNCADYYNAGVFKEAFDEATRNNINRWVAEKTDGKIPEIVDRIPEDAVMYLVNALAFDARWQEPYKKSQIHEGVFTTEDVEKRDVTLMYSEEGVYLEDEKATGFIKYYKDRKYAFVALLPKEGISVESYVQGLTGEKVRQMLSNPEYTAVHAAMPAFTAEYDVEMSGVLKAMGMTDAFSEVKADFSGLGHSTEGNLYINRVLHKTYIRVDSNGTQAGAATAVEINKETAMPVYKVVTLDRPFVYMLIDCENGIPFFIGTMMDPA